MAPLTDPLPRPVPDLPARALAAFVLLSSGITWLLALLMIASPR